MFRHAEVLKVLQSKYIVPSSLVGSLHKCVPKLLLSFVFEDATEASLLILPCRNNHGGFAVLAEEPYIIRGVSITHPKTGEGTHS